jgi:long-chain fatty acid transport protein
MTQKPRAPSPLRPLVILCAAVASLSSRPASASPLIETMGSIGGNAGAQGVVSGPGAASTYFNPAALTEAEDSLLVSFALVSEQIGLTYDGRRGGDVPLVVAGRDIQGPNGTPLPNQIVPTQWLQNGCPAGTTPGTCPPPGFAARPRGAQDMSGKTRTYVTVGLVKHLLPDRLSFGFYAMLPLSSFTTANAFYPDEREALFSNSLSPELYGDRLTAISIVLGAGLKLLPNLSIGVGLSLGLTNAAASQTYVNDPSNYDTLLLRNGVSTQANASPTVGAFYKPARWLRFGATVHSPESFDIDTTVTATLPTGNSSVTTRHNVFDWMPWSVEVGSEADVIKHGTYTMSIAASLKYAFWSAYQDRMGQSPSVYGADLGWSDTLSGAIGIRHRFRRVRGFIDLTYTPSPVPEQIGASNYVDNSRVGLALGADYDLVLGPLRIRPGLQLFADRMIYRHNTKVDSRITDELPDGSVFGSTHDPVPGAAGLQTNNPGWPGFASQGWLMGGAFTLQVPL